QWGLGIGTVVEYTKCIVTAINSIGNTYVQWPDSIEQQQISSRIEQLSGFKSCIGFLDRTDIVLEYKLFKDRSVTDSTAYKSTPLYQDLDKFFSKYEYLLADCGYQLTLTTIIPYKQLQANIYRNTVFNEMLAKEHKENINEINSDSMTADNILDSNLNKE
ncbi:29966_t:CDS:2, partial [Racocetra persica]